ncbi:reverse transcriptase domain-containing protein [Tanacetum coccineum]
MIRYLEKVRTLTNSFKAFSITQVPRSENKKADALSKIASTSFTHLSKQVLVEELKEKSISEVEILAVVEEEGDTWMTPIFEYITKETLSADVKKARAFGRRNKSKARYKKQELYGRVTSYSMGTPYHDKIRQRRHSVRINIRNGGSHPSRNWHAYTQNSGAQNNEALEINLSLLEERREEATIREAKSKAKIEKYHNSKVRSASFKPGDLVYRNNDASHAEDTRKLGPKWEGPYEVTEALGKGAYKLRDRDVKQLPRT